MRRELKNSSEVMVEGLLGSEDKKDLGLKPGEGLVPVVPVVSEVSKNLNDLVTREAVLNLKELELKALDLKVSEKLKVYETLLAEKEIEGKATAGQKTEETDEQKIVRESNELLANMGMKIE